MMVSGIALPVKVFAMIGNSIREGRPRSLSVTGQSSVRTHRTAGECGVHITWRQVPKLVGSFLSFLLVSSLHQERVPEAIAEDNQLCRPN